MCGIAGWYDKNVEMRDARSILSAMSEALRRRGPDDDGIYTCGEIALVHRRLAVIDIENGRQPMTRKARGHDFTIVYNGELYNTEELRQELVGRGCIFETRSDTEVVLQSYITYGESCCEKLNGIFAFAVWDSEQHNLFLARDSVGVKPLFFSLYREGLVFASELPTLLKNPMVLPRVDEQGLSELFLIGPGRTSGQGVLRYLTVLQYAAAGILSLPHMNTNWTKSRLYQSSGSLLLIPSVVSLCPTFRCSVSCPAVLIQVLSAILPQSIINSSDLHRSIPIVSITTETISIFRKAFSSRPLTVNSSA